ncbi:MAG: type I methionyl aminopeptidase [Calditrichae bacterium]|nr:type I methionyl aminopeptidase [Calditrichota bacterium]MCB9058024.1 type I methionyl aminopeptidase [Calditrichia bacterium]
MIKYYSPAEINEIRTSAQLVSKTLGLIASLIEPGISTLELDRVAEEFIRDHGAKPAFKGFQGFPNTLCMSRNEEVVHGIPSDKPLENGDVVSVDCGVKLNGYYGDHAYTFVVGEVNFQILKLLRVTKECLDIGINNAVHGNAMGDIAFNIQQHAESHGYGVVRELVGHGVGRNLHEEPQVPNYGKKGKGLRLREGMVLAIEPMINMGTQNIIQLKDGWTIVTVDKKPSAHFEHNVAVMNGKADVLSTFAFVEEALIKKGSVVI